MKKKITIILPLLIVVLSFPVWILVNPQAYAQDKTDFVRLSAHDVLEIIAYPLPEGSKKGYYLPNADISNINLIGIDFKFAQLSNSDFSGSLLVNADLSNASLQEANLSGVNLSNATLSNTWLVAANVQNATIVFAKLDGSNFEGARLNNTDFSSSSLVNVNLTGADLTGASFSGAIMEGVTLPNGKKHKEGDDLVSEFGAKTNP